MTVGVSQQTNIKHMAKKKSKKLGGKRQANGKLARGFAVMSKEQRSRIARMGGKAVMSKKGHAAKIGKLGGRNSHKSRNAAKKAA